LSSRPGTAALDHLTDDDLAARAQRGNDIAQQELIQRYRRFASSKGRGYYIAGGDADDIVQEALIGLYKAIRDYRGDRQASFRVFAELCITRQIMTAIKTARRRKHQPLNQYVSISPFGRDEPPEWSVEHLLDDHRAADPADDIVADDVAQAVDRVLEGMLSGFEVDVLRLFIEGRTYQEIGFELGRHPKSIDNALQRIKRKLGAFRLDESLVFVA
jgi:RNA polymerase sporulation-specific sigma factor